MITNYREIGIALLLCFLDMYIVRLLLVKFCFSWKIRCICLICFFISGSGGFSYLHEPLWWIGMITSKYIHQGLSFLYLIIYYYFTKRVCFVLFTMSMCIVQCK